MLGGEFGQARRGLFDQEAEGIIFERKDVSVLENAGDGLPPGKGHCHRSRVLDVGHCEQKADRQTGAQGVEVCGANPLRIAFDGDDLQMQHLAHQPYNGIGKTLDGDNLAGTADGEQGQHQGMLATGTDRELVRISLRFIPVVVEPAGDPAAVGL